MDKFDKERYWHTSSHILAQAVKRLFPDTKLGTGPAIENGFYYDFYRETPFTPDDFSMIELEMKKIIEENHSIDKKVISREEAEELFSKEPFKLEILQDLENDEITIYTNGEFFDLCEGPHLSYTGEVKYFKILSLMLL